MSIREKTYYALFALALVLMGAVEVAKIVMDRPECCPCVEEER